MKLILFNDCSALTDRPAFELSTRTTLEIVGAAAKAGTVVICSDSATRAPVRVTVTDGAAQLPAMVPVPGERITLRFERSDGKSIKTWSTPALRADRLGVLELPADICYTQLLELKTALEQLSGKLQALDKRFSTREKNSKNPSIGGTKI